MKTHDITQLPMNRLLNSPSPKLSTTRFCLYWLVTGPVSGRRPVR